MLIITTVISILVISVFVSLANRILSFTVCPICAGVFLTWVGLVSAHFMGYSIDLVVPALLMGGSVVGITYQLEKKFRDSSANVLLLWKVFFIPVGFVVAYAILGQLWVAFLSGVTFLFLISFALASSSSTADSHTKATGDIEKKMENCC
ncbi:hypothetical protein A2950_01710 [Candidatus Kaiserbacteria bacterium RIFCSPLOWO2_01_FULL_55_19]|uniref:Uncharacterized protein n=1 Tax=Candidatus Kaiserbacteria bacterium RIFCSPLOWO2_01_FULL_55_19 TaxID=1798516 RepID=A0A1F6ERP9_9BACT|nr:MAG: hypothetical protein A2950_01710 [Candidatus Kaiserbacteria bacterium RIFCSPLOWO2_01_FULL_55_19]